MEFYLKVEDFKYKDDLNDFLKTISPYDVVDIKYHSGIYLLIYKVLSDYKER